MNKNFKLKPGVTTREVLKVVREAHASATDRWNMGVEWTEERRRTKPFVGPGVRSDDVETRYVFGIGTPTRATLTAHYIVGSGELMVVFPNHYKGWDNTGPYDRLRVNIHDRLVHGMHGSTGLVDKTAI